MRQEGEMKRERRGGGRKAELYYYQMSTILNIFAYAT